MFMLFKNLILNVNVKGVVHLLVQHSRLEHVVLGIMDLTIAGRQLHQIRIPMVGGRI
jgi:hypothetical protein